MAAAAIRRPMQLLCLLALALLGATAPAASLAPVAGVQGMVVSAQQLATRVGVATLQAGGNAIDAAVAVGYALAVVYPAAGNLGGGGFMTLQLADGRTSVIDFRERAPLAATAGMYLDPNGQVIPGASTSGHRAVAVPGTVAGLELARLRYGSLPRATLLAPAIHLARDGFVLNPSDASLLADAADALRRDPPSAAIFLQHGMPFQPGQTLVQSELAATLQAISDRGDAGFYQGPVAAALVAASLGGQGILRQADLDQYQALERQPLQCSYRGYGVVAPPPPSSGGVVLCEMLNVLEGLPLRDWGFRSARAVHYQIETMRHAFVDRNSTLGDPDFVPNPLQRLLSKDYAATLRAAIAPLQAGNSLRLQAGVPPHEGQHTTHYTVADRWGNVAAVTYTLNDLFGAKVTAAGTGVLLNDSMDDFSALPGGPNAIAPGKRPLSSMTPTLLTQNGKTIAALGSPGGSRIITAVLHTILNLIDYGMDVQEAVDAPRFHQEWLPQATSLEAFSLSPDTREILQGWGHQFTSAPPANHLAAILLGAPTLGGPAVCRKRFFGANDPRGNTGLALGY